MHKLKREGFILVYIVPVVKTTCIATLMLCVTLALLKKKSKNKNANIYSHANIYYKVR